MFSRNVWASSEIAMLGLQPFAVEIIDALKDGLFLGVLKCASVVQEKTPGKVLVVSIFSLLLVDEK